VRHRPPTGPVRARSRTRDPVVGGCGQNSPTSITPAGARPSSRIAASAQAEMIGIVDHAVVTGVSDAAQEKQAGGDEAGFDEDDEHSVAGVAQDLLASPGAGEGLRSEQQAEEEDLAAE
jgi:hypothetical protein